MMKKREKRKIKGDKEGKRERKKKTEGPKKEIWLAKKKKWKTKKDDFAVTFLNMFFKSGMGRLSTLMEQYTVYTIHPCFK